MCANFLISFLSWRLDFFSAPLTLSVTVQSLSLWGGPDGRTDPVDTDGSPELELSW